jgi:hypothetical protein
VIRASIAACATPITYRELMMDKTVEGIIGPMPGVTPTLVDAQLVAAVIQVHGA